MEEEKIKAKTAFDAATQSHHLEIIKAAIPYINNSEQRVISVYVKASELAETISLFRRPNTNIGITAQGSGNGGSMMDMLNDIKAVCTAREQEAVNMFINFFNAYEMYRTYNQTFGDGDSQSQNNSSNMFDSIKGMLSPEQQQMFDTYSSMLNT
ncbi:hypothetical protein [Candidatus Galacturonibacter soehngenii]|uniref:Uncharacterized protein n=1 Tax=Candidatus Galacturonatibacter soehngenii TaxID=2307010 RepID=A0A7V7QLN9_9FIRM|nr:hypothetical protein [Candidatus Galacturonibacter soehngenii]KAB1439414.1 hypothetical protein F7O84_03175 [Candidatus Galacturonibacter soehngenii]MBA4687276.1 hypothetical protein [Candidatus Galacturonibacter soehngenii]